MTEDKVATQMILYAWWSANGQTQGWPGAGVPTDASALCPWMFRGSAFSADHRAGDSARTVKISGVAALLVRCGYPLDKQPAATNLVMQQVELFAHSAADRRGRANLASGRRGRLRCRIWP
jgi:hypothetical protein